MVVLSVSKEGSVFSFVNHQQLQATTMAPDGTKAKESINGQKSSATTMTSNGNVNSNYSDTLNPTVEDQVHCGTSQILESHHVREGPGRIANAPVPSVFVSSLLL